MKSRTMNSLVFLFLAAITVVSAKTIPRISDDPLLSQFEEFMKTYDKKYSDLTEKQIRYGIFLKNLDMIEHLNSHSTGEKFGITKFADLTNAEIEHFYKGYKPSSTDSDCKVVTEVEDFKTDDQFDWRDKNVVSRVKNQGYNCGSCWAFSAIGNLESINAIKVGSIQELSEQQLVDCDKGPDDGCHGGLPSAALTYLKSNGSISEADYPYRGHEYTCHYDANTVAVRPTDCEELRVDENGLAIKLQQIGPLSIAIDSTILHAHLQGIVQGDYCIGKKLTHAALLVGFGQENGVKFWIIKNSWGENWGENGYFRIQRGVNCLLLTSNVVTAVM